MANRVLDDELEHIDLGLAPPPAPRRHWSRRHMLALGTAVVALASLLGPVSATAVTHSFRRVEAVYAEAVALDDTYAEVLGRLFSRSVAGDEVRVRAAARRLASEHDHRAAVLRDRLRRDRLAALDGRVRRLRDQLDDALDPDVRGGLLPLARQVDDLRRSFGLRPSHAPEVRLHTVDADLAALRRYIDVPTGVLLLVDAAPGPRLVDIDRSRVAAVAVGPPSPSDLLVTDRGTVVQPTTEVGPFSILDSDGRTIARYRGWPFAASHHLIARMRSIVHDPGTSTGDVIDAATGRVRYQLPDIGPVFGGVFSPDERFLALLNGASVYVVELATGAPHEIAYGTASSLAQVAWSPSSRWLLYGGRDLFAWDAGTSVGYQLRTGTAGLGAINGMVAVAG